MRLIIILYKKMNYKKEKRTGLKHDINKYGQKTLFW